MWKTGPQQRQNTSKARYLSLTIYIVVQKDKKINLGGDKCAEENKNVDWEGEGTV